jgi:hypothetical protein
MKLTLFALLALAAVPLAAHHSFKSMYSEDKPVTLQGVVTKTEWVNPHTLFYLDVKDAGGKVTNWKVEVSAPNALVRAGVAKSEIQDGDQIAVEGFQAKDNSSLAIAGTLTLANGRVLKTGLGTGWTADFKGVQ